MKDDDFEVIDLKAEFKADSTVGLSESDRPLFAKQVLFTILAIVVVGCAFYAASPDNKALAQIFEFIKIGALPIITLLISFYFPNSKK